MSADASDWRPVCLGDVCDKIGSGATPRGGKKVYFDDGPFALIRSQNVYNEGFHREGLAHIGEAHAKELSNVEVEAQDVLLNITGDSVARVCKVDPTVLPARVNQHVMLIRPDPQRLDPAFLRYALVSPVMQAKLLAWAASGGTRKALTKGMIEVFEVVAPPQILEQRAIARILGSLDDKTELNREMNRTLESIAQAIFRSWFVDFDPVVAKADGRKPYGMSDELAALFPHRFVDSELGSIPEGWKCGILGQAAQQIRDGVQPEDVSPDSAYLGLEHMPRNEISLSDWGRAEEVSSNKSRFQQRQILFGKLRPYFHKVGVAFTEGICSTDIIVIDAEPRWWGFALGHLSSPELISYADSHSSGTRQPRTNWRSLSRYRVVLPTEEIAARYSELVAPMISMLEALIHESRTLAELRDTLLPKLLSGEIRVADAEKAVEASA